MDDETTALAALLHEHWLGEGYAVGPDPRNVYADCSCGERIHIPTDAAHPDPVFAFSEHIAARLTAANVRVAPSPTEVDIDEMQEAVRRALLFVFQAKQMTPMTALAVIRALEQDGYVVVPVERGVAPSLETPELDVKRLARALHVPDAPVDAPCVCTVYPDDHTSTARWIAERYAASAPSPETPGLTHSDGDSCTGIHCGNPEHGWNSTDTGHRCADGAWAEDASVPTETNEHGDRWCSRCGERILIPVCPHGNRPATCCHTLVWPEADDGDV